MDEWLNEVEHTERGVVGNQYFFDLRTRINDLRFLMFSFSLLKPALGRRVKNR